jgi:glycine cleavage system aminomethyltransferase T
VKVNAKIMSKTPTTTMVAAAAVATTIMYEVVVDEDAEVAEDIIMVRMITYQTSNVRIVTKKETIPRTARHLRKMEIKTQTWFQKRISKICFNPQLRKCLPKGKIRKSKKTPPICMKGPWI